MFNFEDVATSIATEFETNPKLKETLYPIYLQRTCKVFNLVLEERIKHFDKGFLPYPIIHDEYITMAMAYMMRDMTQWMKPSYLIQEKLSEEDMKNIKECLLRVAALAVAMVECIFRGEEEKEESEEYTSKEEETYLSEFDFLDGAF